MKPTVRLEHHLIALETEQTVYAMVELDVPQSAIDSPRTPLDLAVVIDRSGSMAGAKLAVTKDTTAFLIRRLSQNDRVAVVAYDDDVDLVVPLAPSDGDGLIAAVAAIGPGSRTNLSGGWLKGIEVLQGANRHSVRKVLLLTDGQANAGITDAGVLIGIASGAAASGIGTTTIGFGDDFDERLLTSIADAGAGSAYYAETPESAPAIFASEFEGLATVVAQNVSAEIRPSDDVTLVGVLNEYRATKVKGGLQLALGDAYGGEHLRAATSRSQSRQSGASRSGPDSAALGRCRRDHRRP